MAASGIASSSTTDTLRVAVPDEYFWYVGEPCKDGTLYIILNAVIIHIIKYTSTGCMKTLTRHTSDVSDLHLQSPIQVIIYQPRTEQNNLQLQAKPVDTDLIVTNFLYYIRKPNSVYCTINYPCLYHISAILS